MANPLQQAATRRKVIYLGIIIGLFTLSLFWRGKIGIPMSTRSVAAAQVQARTILGQADRLELRELDQGDANLGTSVAQVSMVGFRGPMVTILWKSAIEKQKRGEYHEFEHLARLVTFLQPHFIDPWLFQSWNIAYNVSVENDKLGDMFYYIARGIELLAEGDRMNSKIYKAPDGNVYKIGSPELREKIGFYYQNKFGVSDKVSTLRCLMQLACIPPNERDPRTFKRDGRIDMEKFRTFCEKNPQLVRRLRTKLNCDRPEEVVQFLEDNVSIPTRYKPDGSLAADIDQFPILPPKFDSVGEEYSPLSKTDDTFDAFHAARAWFGYSCTVIPPPKKDSHGEVIPWFAPKPEGDDQYKYRMPRSPAYIVFRQSPARAQTYLAERLSKEGWFDEKSTWDPDARSNENNWWFKRSPLDPDVGLKTGSNSKFEWQRAFQAWKLHGELNGLLLPEYRRANLQQMARKVPVESGLPPDYTPEQLKSLGITQDEVDAKKALVYYDQNRQITNFAFFYASSNAEADDRTIEARKLLWRADDERQNGENVAAIRDYIAGLAAWREVLILHDDFHHPARNERTGQSDHTEEETFEFELNLVRLLRDEPSVAAQAKLPTQALFSTLADTVDESVLQSVAENEAAIRVSALDPRVRQAAESLAEHQANANLPVAHHLMFALVGPAAGSVETGKPDTMRLALKDGIKASLLRSAERSLLAGDFAWLKRYKSKAQDDPWVGESVKQVVKSRLGLIRQTPQPQPASGEQPPQEQPGR